MECRIIWAEEEGRFIGTIKELPGLKVRGRTESEALAALGTVVLILEEPYGESH